MNFDEINQLTVEKTFPELLSRILNTSSIPEGEPLFMMDLDESKSFYDRIIVHQSLVKPPLSNLEAELTELKSEKTQAYQDYIDELARVEDIKTRFSAIKDPHSVFARLSKDIVNPALEMERIIKEKDEPALAQLESEFAAQQAERAEQATKDAKMAFAKGLVNTVHGCVEIIMKHNIDNGLSKTQKDQQASDYSDAFNALKDWRPGKFKSAITVLTPDGTLVTQELKDELLLFLSESGI